MRTDSRRRTSSTRPNVLLVIADEWRAQAFGYAGDTNAHTPAIDAFAAQSVNFSQAVSGCSVCCPARASLITGQYPLTHRVFINDVPLAPTGTTLAAAYRKAGYSTGYIGKWHLYGSPDGSDGRREEYIPSDKRFGFEYWKAAECTHDYNHSFYYEGDDRAKRYWEGYDAIAQTDDACRFIHERVKGGDSYLLVLSWGPPHFPLDNAPAEFQAMYKDRNVALRPNVPSELSLAATQELRGYYAHIAALDFCFKRLLDSLEATGTATDTVVVFMSDHGDMMRSQGLLHKLHPWEESIRIPLLVRYPRRFGMQGHENNAAINMPDILPTLLGLSGLPVPEGIQGVDFSGMQEPRLTDSSRSSSFLSMPVPITTSLLHGIGEYRGVRTQRHTYVRGITGPWLLYDNVADPYQMHNLCGNRQWGAVQEALDGELERWLKRLDDGFLPASEYVRRAGVGHFMELQWPIGRTYSPWGDWKSTLSRPERLSSNSMIKDIVANPAAKAAAARAFPQITSMWQDEWVGYMSLRLLQHFGVLAVSLARLDEIDAELATIEETSSVASQSKTTNSSR